MDIAATERNAVLVELEAMQNDLLDRLDDLDRRVCLVLKEWTNVRQVDAPLPNPRVY